MIGYVPQQEIIYENLTLCHMLRYTAKMKMPKDTDAQEVDKRINEVLEMVELTEHKDTFIRKLSGGQKKQSKYRSRASGRSEAFLPGRADIRT